MVKYIFVLIIFFSSVNSQPETTLYFVGDIMLDRGVLHYIKENENWRWPFLKIQKELERADLVFGNLESMISDKGHNVGGKYSFRAPPETIKGLSYAGFDVLSVANNHSLDYTVAAFLDTLERLKKENIDYTGGGENEKQAHEVLIKQVNNLKIGFLGYTSVGSSSWQAQKNSPGITWMDLDSLDILKKDIEKAKEQVNILVVSFHFGREYEKEPSHKQTVLAEKALEFGADIIAGHHPHVVQPLEKKENGIIAYSLGNFVFDQYFSKNTMKGAILKVVLKEKQIVETELLFTKINEQYQVEIDHKEKQTCVFIQNIL